MSDENERRERWIARARARIQEGADDLDQGRFVDGETFFREWDAELDAIEERWNRQSRDPE